MIPKVYALTKFYANHNTSTETDTMNDDELNLQSFVTLKTKYRININNNIVHIATVQFKTLHQTLDAMDYGTQSL